MSPKLFVALLSECWGTSIIYLNSGNTNKEKTTEMFRIKSFAESVDGDERYDIFITAADTFSNGCDTEFKEEIYNTIKMKRVTWVISFVLGVAGLLMVWIGERAEKTNK
jgi:hypothetical protein